MATDVLVKISATAASVTLSPETRGYSFSARGVCSLASPRYRCHLATSRYTLSPMVAARDSMARAVEASDIDWVLHLGLSVGVRISSGRQGHRGIVCDRKNIDGIS